jgi:hypothetical protein
MSLDDDSTAMAAFMVLGVFTTFWVLLFAGEPDLWDVVLGYLQSQVTR